MPPRGSILAFVTSMRKALTQTRELLWAVDALLFVMAYTALLLLIPTPSPKWRRKT
jgi:hypothetical protein